MLIKHGFPPIFDPHARVLILGSLPGDESLRRGQYYGHPRNQFWALLGAVFERDLPPLEYERKCAFLLRKRIALWDVLKAAERRGSLDTAIRKERPNDLPALFGELPGLRAVGCNGGKAHRSFRRHFGAWLIGFPGEIELCRLPSSSPAYAAMPLEAKARQWRQFLDAALSDP
ncbi:MAG: DNA-deoxyinosine glycosylase [Gammaproteobacteria bacterium]|nr:DNA-deoxyinosine glycosylase [Gammaproteobacteria bacterium]